MQIFESVLIINSLYKAFLHFSPLVSTYQMAIHLPANGII